MSTLVISIRSDRICRVLRKITGGRHVRRPCFDFGTQIRRDFISSSRLDLSNRSQLRDVTYLINKDLTSLVIFGNIRLLFRNLAASRTTKRNIVVMALNKLSIDKVELTDKRVLIRYVFSTRKSSRKRREVIFTII